MESEAPASGRRLRGLRRRVLSLDAAPQDPTADSGYTRQRVRAEVGGLCGGGGRAVCERGHGVAAGWDQQRVRFAVSASH